LSRDKKSFACPAVPKSCAVPSRWKPYSEHSVCTAIQNSPQSPQEVAEATAIPNYFQSPPEEPIVIANTTSSENNFSLLTCESLLSALQPITKYSSAENEAWKDFCQKVDKKPF